MSRTDRVLALLEALQDRPSATGPELARRLGVDVRTVRRDIVALRELGIPVEGERGRGGSYRLKRGYRIPPLMFTAAEGAAVTLGLLAAQRMGVEAEGALAKVRRVLPDRVGMPVKSLEQTLGFTGELDASPPDLETVLALADAACRHRSVNARYTDSEGRETDRELSPYGVVAHGGRWYIAAHDHERGEPRAYRADRFASVRPAGRATPPPDGFDPVAFVSRALARVPWAHDVVVILHTDFATAARHFPPTLAGLEPESEHATRLTLRADSLDWAAGLLAGVGCDFTIVRPKDLRDAVQRLGERLSAAARASR